eukprot:Blabericola_migrator_1__7039@NODE_356_length_9460_cov_81_744810_g285_i0_p5_GENE_NODE_356_length_9460_cov_81_744810_g285_i0NODE_356_length_9460_cov_81_744810_g285_i0_p5_ORF_typecomplete_len156_score22_47DUF2431/PF10354_9/1_7e11_NODE_356_length_9460_cov_81_744810_g285_i084228889
MHILLVGEGDYSFSQNVVKSLKYHHKVQHGFASTEDAPPARKIKVRRLDRLLSLDFLIDYFGLTEKTPGCIVPNDLTITSTSLDTRAQLLEKYPNSKQILQFLDQPRTFPKVFLRFDEILYSYHSLQTVVETGLDATQLDQRSEKYDRICWYVGV